MNSALLSRSNYEAIEQLRRLTQEILDCARKGDWDNAILIEVDRRPLLQAVFGVGTPDIGLKPLLQEILAADREVMTLTQLRHDELAGSVRQVGRGRTALRAYEVNSR